MERAFGHHGLGVAVVTGVPHIATCRIKLFLMGYRYAFVGYTVSRTTYCPSTLCVQCHNQNIEEALDNLVSLTNRASS